MPSPGCSTIGANMKPTTPLLLAPICLVVGAAFGVLVRDLVAAPEPRQWGVTQDSVPATASPVMLAALGELRASIEALRDELAMRPTGGVVAPREPAGDGDSRGGSELDGTGLSQLLSAMQDLTIAVRASHTGGSSTGGSAAVLREDAWTANTQVYDVVEMRGASLRGEHESFQEMRGEFAKAHLLRTKEEIMSVYGKPEHVWAREGNVVWSYNSGTEDGGTDYISFTFHEGTVFLSEYSHQTP